MFIVIPNKCDTCGNILISKKVPCSNRALSGEQYQLNYCPQCKVYSYNHGVDGREGITNENPEIVVEYVACLQIMTNLTNSGVKYPLELKLRPLKEFEGDARFGDVVLLELSDSKEPRPCIHKLDNMYVGFYFNKPKETLHSFSSSIHQCRRESLDCLNCEKGILTINGSEVYVLGYKILTRSIEIR